MLPLTDRRSIAVDSNLVRSVEIRTYTFSLRIETPLTAANPDRLTKAISLSANTGRDAPLVSQIALKSPAIDPSGAAGVGCG